MYLTVSGSGGVVIRINAKFFELLFGFCKAILSFQIVFVLFNGVLINGVLVINDFTELIILTLFKLCKTRNPVKLFVCFRITVVTAATAAATTTRSGVDRGKIN